MFCASALEFLMFVTRTAVRQCYQAQKYQCCHHELNAPHFQKKSAIWNKSIFYCIGARTIEEYSI